MLFLWIIISLILFTIIVLFHELGHFASARFFGVEVKEFWLWIPPRAKKLFKDKKWTLFSLNWLPLWWFVRLTWEAPNSYLVYDKNKKLYDNESLERDIKNWEDIYNEKLEKLNIDEKKEILKWLEENKANYNLMNKASWKQSIIILAWVFMNFLLAFFIFLFLFLFWVKPVTVNVTEVWKNLDLKLFPNMEQALKSWILKKSSWFMISPISWGLAEKSNLKIWDVILSINNKNLLNSKDFVNEVEGNIWKEIILSWYRLNPNYKPWCNCKEKEDLKIKLKVPESGKIWVYFSENIIINKDFKYNYGFSDSLKFAFLETKNQILFTFDWLFYLWKKIFSKDEKERNEAVSKISWPIWIVNIISEIFVFWFVFLLIIWAIISINLWVFNLLPIPALDGWRFIFVVINGLVWRLFGRKLFSQNLESIIHFIFFIILIALSIFIWYNDVIKIINK